MARERLHAQGHVPRVSVTHKRDLRKLVVQLSAGRLVIAREPAHAGEIAEFCAHFGLEYRGASLCAAVGSVMEKLLKPKRAAISEKLRDEVYEAQGHRCAICDGELRCGEDHGDHVDVLRDQVAGQRQRFRLLCATCNYAICDAGQRREGEILKSHYSLETASFEDSPKPVPATWGGALDKRRDLWHIDVIRCRRSLLYEGFEWPVLCARDEWVQATPENAATLDYIWVRGATPGCLSKSLAKLPFQGSRFYHACAVRFMQQQHLIQYADLSLGILSLIHI